jgi:serine phosphatase RsbU (regulator of sigma subunit)
VTEALKGESEEFGEDRLRDVITASLGGSAGETIDAICGALAAFTGGAEPADDVTVVVVRRSG